MYMWQVGKFFAKYGKLFSNFIFLLDVTSLYIKTDDSPQENETSYKMPKEEEHVVEIHYDSADENELLIQVMSSEAGPNDYKGW